MSINEEPVTPDQETSGRRTRAEHREEWIGSVPEDSPGRASGTGPLGTSPEHVPDEVPTDSPGPASGTAGGVPLQEDRLDVPEDSPGPRSGTGPDGRPVPENEHDVPEDSPGKGSGR